MRVLIALLAVLLLPASASAATLGEVPPLDLLGDEYCVRATGLPGELAVPTYTGVRLVQATKDGLTPGRQLTLGTAFNCGTVAGQPNGAAVIAGETATGVVAVVRDPGGDWGAPQTVVAENPDSDPLQVVAGISERGDVIVGLKERDSDKGYRFRVVRRPPGGAFGAPEQLGATIPNTGSLTVAVAATGEAFALSTTIEGKRAPFREPVNVAIAPPGQPFGASVHVGDSRWLSGPALAVAADGRALVTVPDGASLLVAEREPGAAGFGPTTAVASAADTLAVGTSVRLGANGAAAIGWVRALSDEVTLLQRSGPGAFPGPPRVVLNVASLYAGFDPFYSSQTFLGQLFGTDGDIGGSFMRGDATAFLTLSPADGRALLASATGPLGDSNEGVGLATAGVDGVLRDLAGAGRARPTRALPFTLADGTRAIAWTTSLATPERYRLHVATPATVERPDPDPPRVTVGRQDRTRVSDSRAVHLPITCSGPCEVNAYLEVGGFTIPYAVRMSKAGTRRLELDGLELLATPRLTRVRIPLTYGAPGALHPRTRTISVRVRRSGRPEPRVTGLRAVRRGDEVVVTVRVRGNTDDWGAFISGSDTREWSGEPAATRGIEGRDGKASYRVTLPAAGVRYVTLRTPRLIFLPGHKLVTEVR